jgi:hypothetical protein
MNPDDLDPLLLIIGKDFDKTLFSQRILVHGDLVPLGEVRIKIVLPGEKAVRGDPAGSGQPQFDGKFDSLPVDHRKGTGLSSADRTSQGIGFFPESGGTTTEYLRLSEKLSMYFQTDDGFVFHSSLLSFMRCRF